LQPSGAFPSQPAIFDILSRVDYRIGRMNNRGRKPGTFRAVLFGLAGFALLSGGCNRMNSKSAIQAAIDAHLKQRPGLALSNMTTDVQEVKFDGDQATAQVIFQSKENAELKVEVRYVLRREGDHWTVESSTPMGGMGANPHSGANATGANGGASLSVPANPPGVPPPQPSH
jgi:hypothetical protein